MTVRWRLQATDEDIERSEVTRAKIIDWLTSAPSSAETGSWQIMHHDPTSSTGRFIRTALTDRHSSIAHDQVVRDETKWASYVLDRLDKLSLADDGQPAPTPEVINRARNAVIDTLPLRAPAPSVLPTTDGGVDFVWHQNGWNVEIGVDRDGAATLWTWNRIDDLEHSGDLAEGKPLLREVLESFSET